MPALNINTASKEELMTLKDIGEVRASLIIKAREQKGKLDLESLKLIEGLPNTMWDPLVQSGRVIFEEQVTEQQEQNTQTTNPVTQGTDNLLQQIEQYKTKLLIADQDKKQMKREFCQQIEDLMFKFKEQMTKKGDELESLLEDIQNEKAKFQAEIEHMKTNERQHEHKVIHYEELFEAERQNLKKFKKDIEDHYSSVLVNKEMEFESFKESAGKQRFMLMDKIREQEDFVNTQREINRNQQMEFNAREEEQNRRFAMIENKMKQLKTSKTISEKLAPSDIYAGRKTTFSDSILILFLQKAMVHQLRHQNLALVREKNWIQLTKELLKQHQIVQVFPTEMKLAHSLLN